VTNPSTFLDPLESINSYLAAVDHFRPSTVKVVPPCVELLTNVRYPDDILRLLERIIRTADKSEIALGPHTYSEIAQKIVEQTTEFGTEHDSALDHLNFTFRIHASHEVTQELARYFPATHTQVSSRYISYEKGIEAARRNVSYADRPLEVVLPWRLLAYNKPEMGQFWVKGMEAEFALYLEAVNRFNWKSEEACGFLPSDSSAEIVSTMSIRSWRNFLGTRTAPEASPDMQVVARDILRVFMLKLPELFHDIQAKVDARVEGKDQWLEKGESETFARVPSTYHQWHAVMPPSPRPGSGLPAYGWTGPNDADLKRDPSKDYYIPYAGKHSTELDHHWAYKLLSRLTGK
jgi:thymidylate synthase ThyX